MLRQYLGALTLAIGWTVALRDSAPFFVLSTESFSTDTLRPAQVSTSTDVQEGLVNGLSDCTSKICIIVSQPGVSAADLTSTWMPHMQAATQSGRYRENVTIAEVLGGIDAEGLSQQIAGSCKGTQNKLEELRWPINRPFLADGGTEIVAFTMPTLSEREEERSAQLIQNDQRLHALLSEIPAGIPFTFIYTASPRARWQSAPLAHLRQYEMDEPFPSAPHTGLKRDLNAYPRQSNNRGNLNSNLPLFETYQFLSPGIFMGFAVSLLLFVILWVGVSAIAGLEVSYKAFDKEMGPSAHKKQRQ